MNNLEEDIRIGDKVKNIRSGSVGVVVYWPTMKTVGVRRTRDNKIVRWKRSSIKRINDEQ